MERAEILEEATRIVCRDREEQYGDPENNFAAIAAMWSAYLRARCAADQLALNGKDVAAMMALLKIARVASGKPKADNWVDLAGYAACGGALDLAAEAWRKLI